MPLSALPLGSSIDAYAAQADHLLDEWGNGESWAIEVFHRRHPQFLDEKIKWLPKRLSPDDIRAAALTRDDARLAVARWYDFLDWDSLQVYADTVRQSSSLVARFEAAVEAVIGGDMAALSRLLAMDRDLVRARSTRKNYFEPPAHRATLLHYVAANGVEDYRQKTPPNAVDIARTLLEAGADPDALADMYGGQCTTMSMLASSGHPAQAGVQGALIDALVDYGASVDARGGGNWTSPLFTALLFGFEDAARALARRGARIDTLAAAAGLNQSDAFARLLPSATPGDRHRALAIAAQLGHADVVRRLIDAGEDPNRYNPPGTHAHATPLHQAALGGHLDVVKVLVERGARIDIRDTIYQGTPLGWAEHGERPDVVEWLRSRDAAS